jgi:hypothetical protein
LFVALEGLIWKDTLIERSNVKLNSLDYSPTADFVALGYFL